MGRFTEIEQYLGSIKESSPDYLSGTEHWATVADPYYMSMRRYDDALSVLAEFRQSGEETNTLGNNLTITICLTNNGYIDSALKYGC